MICQAEGSYDPTWRTSEGPWCIGIRRNGIGLESGNAERAVEDFGIQSSTLSTVVDLNNADTAGDFRRCPTDPHNSDDHSSLQGDTSDEANKVENPADIV